MHTFSIGDVVDDDGAAVGRRGRVLGAGLVLGRLGHAALQVLVQDAHGRLVPRVKDPLLLGLLLHLWHQGADSVAGLIMLEQRWLIHLLIQRRVLVLLAVDEAFQLDDGDGDEVRPVRQGPRLVPPPAPRLFVGRAERVCARRN